MARIKTKDLKTQYMIRVYNQDEFDFLSEHLKGLRTSLIV